MAEKESFARLLDASWQGFRSQLLDAYDGRSERLEVASLAEQAPPELKLLEQKLKDDEASPKIRAVSNDSSQEQLRMTMDSAESPRVVVNADSLAGSEASSSSGPAPLDLAAVHTASEDPKFPQSPQFNAPFLGAGLKGLNVEEARAVRHRLRVRLGVISTQTLITGKALHDAVCALGLTRYPLSDYNDMVNLISDFISLEFQNPDEKRVSRYSNPDQAVRDRSLFSLHEDMVSRYGNPTWAWPQVRFRESGSIHRAASMQTFLEKQPIRSDNVVPSNALQELFFAQEWEVHRQIFGNGRLLKQFKAMKEILLAGDTNRLVAELTFVRINDLAAPPEPVHPLVYMEPFVAFLIVANGIMIGAQTEEPLQDWSGWTYFECTFASFLVIEILLRLHLLRCRRFFCGPEKLWNYFDVLLGITGTTDVVVMLWTSDHHADIFGTSLLRFCRLIRLVRIVKVFRLKFMRDLRLMVKGLIAGIRTLALSFTLLFCVIYVISGFTTMTIGVDPRTKEIGVDKYFSTLYVTMFTAWRCFTGECVTDEGHSLTAILAWEYKVYFVLAYVASYMLVALGIFNLILAVYVEITMKAAKENEAVTAEQWARESIRIARVTRELLKRFAAAYRLFHEIDDLHSERTRLDISPEGALFTDDDVHEGIAITKDLFLLVIQDRGVQEFMDDLDLPPDRANLFEIIDADCSGTLQITELVQGLLKIRGDISKSDAVAALLVCQSVQGMVVDMRKDYEKSIEELKEANRRSMLTLWAGLEQLRPSKAVLTMPVLDEPPGLTHEAKRPVLMRSEEPSLQVASRSTVSPSEA